MNTPGDIEVIAAPGEVLFRILTDAYDIKVTLNYEEALQIVDALLQAIPVLATGQELSDLLGTPLATEQEVMAGTDSSRPIEPGDTTLEEAQGYLRACGIDPESVRHG